MGLWSWYIVEHVQDVMPGKNSKGIPEAFKDIRVDNTILTCYGLDIE